MKGLDDFLTNEPNMGKFSKKPHKEDNGLWEVFSLYIRLRDSNFDGIGKCISCNQHFFYKLTDCGHFIPRTHKATKYDERNNNLQCVGCNRLKEGNLEAYASSLERKWGIGITDELKAKSRLIMKYSENDFNQMRAEYKVKIGSLLMKKSGEVNHLVLKILWR